MPRRHRHRACRTGPARTGRPSRSSGKRATGAFPDPPHFGGVTVQVVPDNLKSGVTKACFYEPAVNRTYEEMAAHYGTAVVPARPRKPRDKAKVEVAVQIAQCAARSAGSLPGRCTGPQEPAVLLAHRAERSDPGVVGSAQRPRDPASGREPPTALRADREACAQAIARRALCLRRVEAAHGVPRTGCPARWRSSITARASPPMLVLPAIASIRPCGAPRAGHPVRDHMPLSHQRYGDWTPDRLRKWARISAPAPARWSR